MYLVTKEGKVIKSEHNHIEGIFKNWDERRTISKIEMHQLIAYIRLWGGIEPAEFELFVNTMLEVGTDELIDGLINLLRYSKNRKENLLSL